MEVMEAQLPSNFELQSGSSMSCMDMPSSELHSPRSSESSGEIVHEKVSALSTALHVSNAVVKLQKVYRGHRTRLRLADSAVVAEELWWQAIDFARLNHSTISFFDFSKPESPASRWNRVSLHASKVGQGLSKDSEAQKLVFQHWIEAIDPRHRYGHNLHRYYDAWCKTDSGQPFFHWLDLGDGKELDLKLKECSRSKLRRQCIQYLGPQEREYYEYIVVKGTVIHKKTGHPLDTNRGPKEAKWIFVMSTSKKLYVGEKKKGNFHHSSFLAGGATLAAGRLESEQGILQSISASSGHYCPSDDKLDIFLSFLKENGVNMDEVQIHRPSEDYSDGYEDTKSSEVEYAVEAPRNSESPQPEIPKEDDENLHLASSEVHQRKNNNGYQRTLSGGLRSPKAEVSETSILKRMNSRKAANSYQLGHQLSSKWTTGAGPRIGCVADYPLELRVQALEFVNLSPRTSTAPPTPFSYRRVTGLTSPTSHPTSNDNDEHGFSAA